ncbi:MAG: hypothetical protein KBT04_05505 [Bacteroidales bacterium]|nr:hypothetical protein [Candidatus Colimorpha onthohippi]
MKNTERIAITRIISDLIKADSIIDVGEMDMYSRLKEKYGIQNSDERSAMQLPLSEAMSVMSKAGVRLRKEFYFDCCEMTVSDGFCDPTEARLMLALDYCLNEDGNVYSVYSPDLKIEPNQVVYVEGRYDEGVNNEIVSNYRSLVNEYRTIGGNFIYIPCVAKHYSQYNESTFASVAAFLAPNLSGSELEKLIEHLSNMTTVQFCKEQLCTRLGMDGLLEKNPSLLIKISSDYVGNRLMGNFLRIDVDGSVVDTTNKLVDKFKGMLSSDKVLVSNVDEAKGRFLYHGFYKQLFDMYAISSGIDCSIEINPYKGEIRFPELDRSLEGLRKKEKAFYFWMALMSRSGGVSFNQPSNAKQLLSYKKRMVEAYSLYEKVYELFGGEKGKAPDITLQNIRGPIVANIRAKIRAMRGELRNVDDYSITKDSDGVFKIRLDSRRIKMQTSNGIMGIVDVVI